MQFGTFGEWLADGAVAQAKAWQPDLVIYERMAPFGLLAATVLDVPAVRHDLGIAPGHRAGQLRHMACALARHGVPDLVDDCPWLDIAPSSMAGAGRHGWPLRPVPYNGGGVLPGWALRQPPRPRIAVTLGTIVPRLQGLACAPEEIDTTVLQQLITDDRLRAATAEVRAELTEMPPPSALVQRWEALIR